MARNLAKASWVVLPVGDGTSGLADGGGFTATRLKALWAAALRPEGPGVEIESLAKGLALREGPGLFVGPAHVGQQEREARH